MEVLGDDLALSVVCMLTRVKLEELRVAHQLLDDSVASSFVASERAGSLWQVMERRAEKLLPRVLDERQTLTSSRRRWAIARS